MNRDERRERLVVVYTRSSSDIGHLLDVRTGWTACGAKPWRTHPTERVPSSGDLCHSCARLTFDPDERVTA